MRIRSLEPLLAICLACLAMPVTARAQERHEVEIEDVVTNEEAAAQSEPARLGGYLALWFDDLHLEGLDWRFDDPEVAALAGREVDPNGERGGRGRTLAWGVAFGHSLEPTRWLRLPEVRLYLGGASIDGPWHRPEGEGDGLEVRASGVFVAKLELAGGLQYRLGPVIPFAIGRVGLAGYFTSVEVREGSLGALGEEIVCDGGFELGFELGMSVPVGDFLRLHAAWRRTVVGPAGDGLMLGLTIGGPMEQ